MSVAQLSIAAAPAPKEEAVRSNWQRLSDLPEPLGVAGAFAGETGSAIIVAGGTNFPQTSLRRGGQKACYAAIHVLIAQDNKYQWIANAGSLPHPLSYGVSITTDRGVLIIGGCDASRCYPDTYRVNWTPDHGIKIASLPSLPCPLAYMTGAKIGSVVYIAGGQETVADPHATAHFLSLDLSQEGTPQFAWHQLTTWPGVARIVPASCALGQSDSAAFYLFSGRNVQPNSASQILTDAYCYHIATHQWETLPPISPDNSPARCIMGSTAVASGPHTLLLLGGDDGILFLELERLRGQIAKTIDPPAREQLNAKLGQMLDNHPGFSKEIVQYDVLSHRYTRAGTLPHPAPITTPCILWHGQFLIPSGEIKPGIRSPNVWMGSLRSQ